MHELKSADQSRARLDPQRWGRAWRKDLKPPTVFRDTTNAGKRRSDRGLSLADMQDVVRNHERHVQHRRGEHGGFVCEFIRSSGDDTLTVRAEVKQHECGLITGWKA